MTVCALLSDLHFERASSRQACTGFGLRSPVLPEGLRDHAKRVEICRRPDIARLHGVELLLLAGDISIAGNAGWWALAFAEAWPQLSVAFVAGNHDWWHAKPDLARKRLRGDRVQAPMTWFEAGMASRNSATRNAARRVRFLDNEVATIRGIRVWGGSLWFPSTEQTRIAARNGTWSDFNCVHFWAPIVDAWNAFDSRSGQNTVEAAGWIFEENFKARTSISEVLGSEQPPDVIMTHHLPSTSCVAPRWQHEYTNDFFVGDPDQGLLELAAEVGVRHWVYGHTHDSGIGRPVPSEQLVWHVNPRGYQVAVEDGVPLDLGLNPNFKSDYVFVA